VAAWTSAEATTRPAAGTLCILVVSFVGDIAVNQFSFRLGIRDTGW
jgi:hypothetical protein